MTDDQVRQIVEALQGNPWEPWIAGMISVVSIVIGFLLALWQQTISDRKRRVETVAERRRLTVLAAAEGPMRLAFARDSEIADELRLMRQSTPGVLNGLDEADASGHVAGWWLRATGKLMRMPPPGQDGEGLRDRARVALLIADRLQKWQKGEQAADEFIEANDSAWEAVWAEDSAHRPSGDN
ncbi:hypothetical protein [Microbacterium mcarthurae (nom. nud.)]|uniref:Secreted protein n=1 Tax=Microbacterium mcarthurae TaxID=3035918 RepID=A0ABW9GFC3_9MICO